MTACTARYGPGSRLGFRCKECDHVIALHSGAHNPSLEACLVCELLELKQDLTSKAKDAKLLP